MKSKIELILEDKFGLVDKDDDFYFVSKEFLDEDNRNKVVLAVRYMEEEDEKDRIVITVNTVKSLSLQKNNEIKFMLGYYSFDGVSIDDVLRNREKYEFPGLYVDLYEDGFYEEIDMINLTNEETIKEINSSGFWQDSNTLISKALKALSSIGKYQSYDENLISQGNIYTKSINGLKFTISLPLLLKAINSGWESSKFISNDVIVSLKGPAGEVVLEVAGEVKITDTRLNKAYSNEETFNNEDIQKAINKGDIYNSDRYIVNNNNWFRFLFFDKNQNSVDDLMFESEPNTIEEIILAMESAYQYFKSLEEDIKKRNKYLITVLEEFCFDGQITENDYCLDRFNSDDISHTDYDKRDFFGDFVLGIEFAESMDMAIELASKKYQMEKDMLNAYKLA